MTPQMKECKCKKHTGERLLPLSMFYKNKTYKDGYHGTCKMCSKLEQKTIYADRQDERRKSLRDSYHRNRETRRHAANEQYHKHKNDMNAVVYKMFHNAKSRASKKQIEFSITLDDIVIPEYCPIFGVKLQRATGVASDASPTLDRIDSSRGYTKDNIHVICKRANTIKNAGTPEEHKRIYEYFTQHTDQNSPGE